MGFFKRHRHHNAFAGGQAVSLDHNGRALLVHIAMSLVCGSKGCIRGGGNAVTLHERLGKILGCFQSRRLPRGTENLQAGGAESIHYALGKRRLRSDDGKPDGFFSCKLDKVGNSRDGKILQVIFHRRARIAGGDKNGHRAGSTVRLEKLPGQRMLPAATADNK